MPAEVLVDEARRDGFSVLVMRGSEVIIDFRAPDDVPHPIPIVILSFGAYAAAIDTSKWDAGFFDAVCANWGLLPEERDGVNVSRRGALRIVRGILSADPDADVSGWTTLSADELVVVPRKLFDSWRGAPQVRRDWLTAVEPLVDKEMSMEAFGAALDERLGSATDAFKSQVMSAQLDLFERRATRFGMAKFGSQSAVVAMPAKNLVAAYSTTRSDRSMRSLVPFLRALD